MIESSIPTVNQQLAVNLVTEMCGDRQDAAAYVFMFWDFALGWDHVVDGDPIDMETYDRAMKNALLLLPCNTFFIENRMTLIPVMSAVIGAWQHSNKDGAPKIKAFDIYTEIPSVVAYLLGGQTLVDQYIPKLREVMQTVCKEDDLKDGGKK
jgi:hypothetical protein